MTWDQSFNLTPTSRWFLGVPGKMMGYKPNRTLSSSLDVQFIYSETLLGNLYCSSKQLGLLFVKPVCIEWLQMIGQSALCLSDVIYSKHKLLIPKDCNSGVFAGHSQNQDGGHNSVLDGPPICFYMLQHI